MMCVSAGVARQCSMTEWQAGGSSRALQRIQEGNVPRLVAPKEKPAHASVRVQ